MSQRVTVLSVLAAARVFPSGECHRGHRIGGTGEGLLRRCGWLGSLTSQSSTVLSAPPVARMRPSGENVTESTVLGGMAGEGIAEDFGLCGIADIRRQHALVNTGGGENLSVGEKASDSTTLV